MAQRRSAKTAKRKAPEKTAVTLRPIDRVRQSYDRSLRSIVIPEWDNLELYFGKITQADMEAVDAREPKTKFDRNLLLIVHKARTADGKPAFQESDRVYLKSEADFVILTRLVEFMFGAAFDLEALKAELDSNPT